MKKSMVVLCFALCILFCGCSVFNDPGFAGRMSGRAIYLTYDRIAQKQSPEFKKKVADIWTEINKVHSHSDLKTMYVTIFIRFDDAIDQGKLSETEKMMLESLKYEIATKISSVIDTDVVPNSDGIEFLIGMRNGINEMIQSDKNK